ncbi:MAG TPA: hypothetical protein VMR37_03595 [Rhabdochlamydiaceae bacterium]|jgi:hypothetical protein|nr:hypothetical protein [Rhabdochlamydiaceae bacterium]
MTLSVSRTASFQSSCELFTRELLADMKETARQMADCLMTDDPVIKQDFETSFLITFMQIEETKRKLPPKILKLTVGNSDLSKDSFPKVFSKYAWFCGYSIQWNQEKIVAITGRF